MSVAISARSTKTAKSSTEGDSERHPQESTSGLSICHALGSRGKEPRQILHKAECDLYA
jgi:hypothetical protein